MATAGAAAAAAATVAVRSRSRSRRRSSSKTRRNSTPHTVNLVHFSSREIKEWGKIPKQSEYSNALTSSRHRTSFSSGKPQGLWYAFEKDWLEHYKPTINARKNMSVKNKAEQFDYKYVFEVPKSAFTTNVEPDDSKILVLTLDNFAEFLVKYNAPGIFPDRMVWGGRKPKPIEDWYLVWEGLPAEYTIDKKDYIGVKNLFAGVEFSQDLVEFKPENGFTISSSGKNKMGRPKIMYEFELSSGGAARHVVADVSFLRYLEVRSGCFFKPENLFTKPPAYYLAEGPAAGSATGAAAGAASAAAAAGTE